MQRAILIALFCTFLASNAKCAENIYVDNLRGLDRNDGLSEWTINPASGPVRTIRRAVELATPSCHIHIKNNGTPYYDSFSLVGRRLSGDPQLPLTIHGNGITLSGLRQLPPAAWSEEANGLWRLSFTRKGYYRILRDGFSVTEHRLQGGEDPRPSLPEGQWCAYRGDVFFRQTGTVNPIQERFDYAADEIGITLYDVTNVRIENLTVQHFRVDGINAQNLCKSILLENVSSIENGRAGLAAAGSSSVELQGSRLRGNGHASAFVSGRADLLVENSEHDVEPTVIPLVR